jgi:hypothetical protein
VALALLGFWLFTAKVLDDHGISDIYLHGRPFYEGKEDGCNDLLYSSVTYVPVIGYLLGTAHYR